MTKADLHLSYWSYTLNSSFKLCFFWNLSLSWCRVLGGCKSSGEVVFLLKINKNKNITVQKTNLKTNNKTKKKLKKKIHTHKKKTIPGRQASCPHSKFCERKLLWKKDGFRLLINLIHLYNLIYTRLFLHWPDIAGCCSDKWKSDGLMSSEKVGSGKVIFAPCGGWFSFVNDRWIIVVHFTYLFFI